MGDATDIDKAEYDGLRTEIIFHQTNASTIFALNITALGVGVTASTKLESALLVLAVLSCVLWFRYSDHVMGLFRVAAYLETVLRPRIVERLREPVLGWESFLRTGFAGPGSKLPALPTLDSRMGILVASSAFLVPPPLLCTAFAVRQWQSGSHPHRVALVVAVAAVLVVWLYTMTSGVRAVSWIRTTDRTLRSLSEAADDRSAD